MEQENYLEALELTYKYSTASNTSSTSDVVVETHDARLPFKFVQYEEIFSLIRAKIEEIKREMCLDEHLIMFLLFTYKWSREKLQEVYYDAHYHQFSLKNTQLATPHPPLFGHCSVCETNCELQVNPLCQHAFCKYCWQQYIHEMLEQGKLFFPCMSEGCRWPILKSFADMLTPDLSEQYRRQICRNYARESRTISYCSNPICHSFCEKQVTVEMKVIHCECGTAYCFKCSRDSHPLISCAKVAQWEALSAQNNGLWIKQFTKNCPNCRNPIQKSVGCCKITCICNCQFCYVCGERWSETHSLGKCPKRPSSSIPSSRELQMLGLHKKIQFCSNQMQRSSEAMNRCLLFIKEESIRSLLMGVKFAISDGWKMMKWSSIAIFLEGALQIDSFFQTGYVDSLHSLMDLVEQMAHNVPNLQLRDIYQATERIQLRKQCFLKSQRAWTEAYGNSIDSI